MFFISSTGKSYRDYLGFVCIIKMHLAESRQTALLMAF